MLESDMLLPQGLVESNGKIEAVSLNLYYFSSAARLFTSIDFYKYRHIILAKL